MNCSPMSSRSRHPASRSSPIIVHAKGERVVDPTPQHRRNGRNSGTSRKGYPDRSVLGGEVGLWSSALNSLPAPQAKEAVAEIEELGYAALWFGEAQGREAFTNASMLLSATRSEERRVGKECRSRWSP